MLGEKAVIAENLKKTIENIWIVATNAGRVV
jgi:hypothetical protein